MQHLGCHWMILLGAAVLTGCPADDRVVLDSKVDYLTALRLAAEADDPAAAAQWQQDQEQYRAFKASRSEELLDHPFLQQTPELTDDERIGWDTWVHWTAGNQFFWRDLAQRSQGRLNLLRLLDNQLLARNERFEKFGLINDPDAKGPPRDANGRCIPDRFGLCLDRIDNLRVSDQSQAWLGRPSGIQGLRLFDNPDYRLTSWDPEDPWRPASCSPHKRPATGGAQAIAQSSRNDCYQPPYLVGMTCGFCHISFHPERPPEDPANPEWRNLTPVLGNIFLKEGPLFSWVLDFGADNFYTHYLNAQPPGTSDTSRIATDDIDNPSAINAIFELGSRIHIAAEETMPNRRVQAVPRVLKDGADSTGVALAALRVYVSIGMLGNYWLDRHDSYLLLGGAPRPQQPFKISTAMVTPDYAGRFAWNQTQARIDDLKAFLSTGKPFKLSRAVGGVAHLSDDLQLLEHGKQVFADHCARCHSSKQPTANRRSDPNQWRAEMRELVATDSFLTDNFLSNDRRYPLHVVGVNSSRAMATNAVAGHIWNDFSSAGYKAQLAVKAMNLPDPFVDDETLRFRAPAGGRGYYRTTSLASLWATAPFFHNNSVGRHVHDPSVEARLTAFEDAVEQLLWPERRTDPVGNRGPYIKRTGDQVTFLELSSGVLLPIPPNYPIKVLGNLRLHDLMRRLPQKLVDHIAQPDAGADMARKDALIEKMLQNDSMRKLLRSAMLQLSAAPDFVENKGHEDIVGRIESDEDKLALAEYLKLL